MGKLKNKEEINGERQKRIVKMPMRMVGFEVVYVHLNEKTTL